MAIESQAIKVEPALVPITVRQGATLSINVTITDKDTGNAVNLTGSTMTFKVYKLDGTDAISPLTIGSGITLTDPTNGDANITVTATQTDGMPTQKTMYYGLDWTSGAIVTPVLAGPFEVTPKIPPNVFG